MATSSHIDYRKIDYDQLIDKPITRVASGVNPTTAGVYDRGDGNRFIVTVDGQNIVQTIELKDGYQERTSANGGSTWTEWKDVSFANPGEEIMPTPSAEEEGKIIQYVGETDENFTHGYFYECVGDGQDPETYSWVNVPTQDSVEYTADEGIEIVNGTRVDYSAMRGPCDAGFHVPTIEEMGAVFVDAGFTKEEVRNYLHVSLGFYSIEYDHTPASVYGGFYYCCNRNSSTRNVYYWTWNAMNPRIQGAKGTGRAYPIRAFKDVPSLPDATRTKTLTKGNIEVWDNPSIGLITVKINDTYYTLQDKNVGAVEVFSGTDFGSSEETGEDAKKQLGKLFQFGNNYGFYLTDLASHTTSNEEVDVSSYAPSTYQSSTFIITSTYTDNIYTGSYRDLWGGETGPQTITLHNAITNTGVLSINGQTGHVIIDTGSQAEVMPTPSAENVGQIIQYAGDTNEYYTHAHFYEVIEDPENPGQYIYKEVETQSVSSDSVSYDNTDSGLTATNIQEAIDEIAPENIEYDDYSAIQGPCEEGFHIPSITEADTVKSIARDFLGDMDAAREKLHLPIGPCYNPYDDGIFMNNYGHYWTRSSYTEDGVTYSPILNVNDSTVFYKEYRGRALPIRAFKNEYVEPDSTWTVVSGVLGGNGIFYSSALGLISIYIDGDGYTLKDKNEGATTVYNDGDTLTEANIGKLFQWGNNYGFSSITAPTKTTHTLVNTENYQPSTYNSDTFVLLDTVYDDWSNPSNDNLWGDVTGVQHITTKGYDSQNVIYNNNTSIFNSTNVQDALDEISEKIESGSLGVTSYDDLTDTPTIKTTETWYSWEGNGLYDFCTNTLDVNLDTPLYEDDPEEGTYYIIPERHFTVVDKANNYYEIYQEVSKEGPAEYTGVSYEGDTIIVAAPEYEEFFKSLGLTQVTIMDVASEENVGKIVQYMGATNANFTHGYFYECVAVAGTDPQEYEWQNVKVQEDKEGTTTIYLTQAQYDALPAADKANTKRHYYIYTTTGSGPVIGGDDVGYDNTTSGLTATTVQDAIDEVNNKSVSVHIPTTGEEPTTSGNQTTLNSDGYYLINLALTRSYGSHMSMSILLNGETLATYTTASDEGDGITIKLLNGEAGDVITYTSDGSAQLTVTRQTRFYITNFK